MINSAIPKSFAPIQPIAIIATGSPTRTVYYDDQQVASKQTVIDLRSAIEQNCGQKYEEDRVMRKQRVEAEAEIRLQRKNRQCESDCDK